MEFAHVELEADDGEHKDGEEEQQPDLQQRDHGLHDGLEHHLQAWSQKTAQGESDSRRGRQEGGRLHRECLCGQNKQFSRAKWGPLWRRGCTVSGSGEKEDDRCPKFRTGNGQGKRGKGELSV